MNNIQLYFEEGTDLTAHSVEINVNDILTPYTVDRHIINIDSDQVVFGVNMLRLKLLTPFDSTNLKITAFYLDDSISRHTLYLAYSEKDGVKVNNSWLGFYPEITIPFGNPMSWWICECSQKIKYKRFGTNLYEDHEIFYPTPIIITDGFPKMMQDWFKHNFKFHIYHKDELKDFETNRRVPYFKINFDFDESALYKEIHENIGVVEQNKRTHKTRQDSFNKMDSTGLNTYNSIWSVYDTVLPCERGDDLWAWKKTAVPTAEQWPEFHSLLERITNKGIKIAFVFISQTYGYSFVAPHGHQEDYGFYQLTFPLGWTNESYFKIDGVGLLPTDTAFVINSSDYLHGSLNPTDKVRYVIGVCCEFHNDYSILDDFKPY
jgi:hypothetical protein